MPQGHRSLLGNQEPVAALAPAAYTASADGPTLPLDGSLSWTFIVSVGAWTDGTHIIHFEHSEDGVTWAAIPAEDLDGYDMDSTQRLDVSGNTYTVLDATKDGRVDMIAYFGGLRNVRVRREIQGGPVTGAVYGVALLKQPRNAGKNPMRSNWNAPNVEA